MSEFIAVRLVPGPVRGRFVEAKVPAGFPSPADDYFQKSLDLRELLIEHEEATFFIRASGDSMIDFQIHDQDVLVVDRSLKVLDGDIVVAAVNGEFTVKQYSNKGGQIKLRPGNAKYPEIELKDGSELIVWGVVTWNLHDCLKIRSRRRQQLLRKLRAPV